MKHIIRKTVVAGMSIAMATAASAEVQETAVSVTADFASAYVFRGNTFNDGLVIQPGIEVSGFGMGENAGTLAVGVWGNFDVDAPGAAGDSSEFSETDWYASYSLPNFVEALNLSVGFTEYTYPNGGKADKEVNLGAGFDLAGFSLGASANVMVGGFYKGQIYSDLSASYALELGEKLELAAGASIGYLIQGDNVLILNDGLNDGVLDLSASYALGDRWSLGASLAYIAQLDDTVMPDAPIGGYDVDTVAMLSVGASF